MIIDLKHFDLKTEPFYTLQSSWTIYFEIKNEKSIFTYDFLLKQREKIDNFLAWNQNAGQMFIH